MSCIPSLLRGAADFEIEPLEKRRLLAATYYVSPTGNDANNGRSPQSAWQTIGRANGKNWNPGDRLLFEGGQTFSASGSAGANVVANSFFDSGLTGWSDTLGTSAGASSVSATGGRDGGPALQISGAGGVAGARAQDVTVSLVGNQAYKMSFQTLVQNAGSGIRRVGITFTLGGQDVATFYRGFRNTDWDETKFSFVSPGSFDKAYVWVSRYGDSATVFADDITLSKLPNGIVLDASDAGTIEFPLIISSYGVGRATINAGDGIGLWGSNVAAVQVENLNFVGSWNSRNGSGGNVGVGVEFVNTRSDNSKLEHIVVHKADISGFMWAGIRIGGAAAKSGFRGVLITDNIIRGNGDVGIHIRGEFDKNSPLYSNEKVFVARCKVYSNSGIPDRSSTSGNGILMSDVAYGTVERTVVHHNGALSDFTGAGPIGVFAFDATKITFHYNESYENKTGSTRDGAGFDFDSGVTSSVMQNNYAHDNDGAGYLLGQFTGGRPWGRNIVRNNISQNDGRKNSYGGITLSGPPGPYNLIVEHNTIYMSPSSNGGVQSGVRLKYAGTGVHFRNNIIFTTGGVAAIESDKNAEFAQFNGNDFWNPNGLKIKWNSVLHTTLESWRGATGREMSGAAPTGMNVDPQLVAAGGGGTIGNAFKLHELTPYRLRSTSPMINKAVTIAWGFKGYGPAAVDYYGTALTGVRDVGAAEFV
ncbi:MAG: hypothetical protein QOE14_1439 [Humisphaera sp.]|nr:hypothetical protein [Humisphaera sp.]